MSSLQEFLGALSPSRDRRFHTRTTLASLTYVELRDANGGLILNISEEGMALAVADVYEVGERLSRIRFPLPISSQSFEISARIAWVSESKNGVGVQFVDLAPDARNQLSRWMESEKPALEFAQLLKPPHYESHTPEIGNGSSRRIFSDSSARDEEAAARYAEIFPSESTYANHATTLDENQSEHPPLPIRACSPVDSDVSIPFSVAGISTGEVPQDLAASFPSEHAEHFPPQAIPEAIEDAIPQSEGNQPLELLIESSARKALDSFPSESEQSFCRDQSSNSWPELLTYTAPQALEIVEPEIQDASGLFLVEAIHEETHEHAPFPAFGPQALEDKIGPPPDPAAHSALLFQFPEISQEEKTAERGFGFHLVAAVCLFATVGIIVELAGGLGPLGKRFRHAQNSTSPVDAKSPAPPDRTDGAASQALTPPTPQTTDVVHTDASHSESPSDPSQQAHAAHSASRARPAEPAPVVTSPSNIDSANSSSTDETAGKAADKIDDATPSKEKSEEVAQSSGPLPNLPSNNLNSSPAIQDQPPTNPESSPKPHGSNGLLARNAPPAAKPEPELPHTAMPVSPTPAPPKPSTARSARPMARPAPYGSRPPTILVTPPAEGGNPSKVTFPEKAISVSSSFAITSQLSVLVAPEPGPAAAHQPARLQTGELLFYAEPHFPKPKNGRASTETIKVRATIGQQGQVIDVKPVSGPSNLFPAAKKAIREWRYKPTLLNERPVQFQQDVTIEFRPPQRPSRR
jgi:periplasmic protein TonB